MSVIQSTEVSIGVASITPGEFLDPLNDLVERFSWIVMMAMASIGLQKLLLTIASSLAFKILLTVTGGLLVYTIVRRNYNIQNAMVRLFIVALFLRFAIGSVVWANDLVEYFFLEEPRIEAIAKLIETKESLTDLSEDIQKEKEEQSWWEGMKDTLSSLTSDHEQRIKEQTEKASGNIVNLIVVYLAQTILFPIIFLWVFYKVMIWVWIYNWSSIIRPELFNQQSNLVETSAETT